MRIKKNKLICWGSHETHRFDGGPFCRRCGELAPGLTAAYPLAAILTSAPVQPPKRVQAFAPSLQIVREDASPVFYAEEEDHYAAGYEAFSKDLRNPFPPGDPRRDQWFEGWHSAAADAETDRRELEAWRASKARVA